MKKKVREFLERFVAAKDREDAVQNVFYGYDGIDMAYQRDQINWNEHELLLAIIEKMA